MIDQGSWLQDVVRVCVRFCWEGGGEGLPVSGARDTANNMAVVVETVLDTILVGR